MSSLSDRVSELFEEESKMDKRAGEVLSIDRSEKIPWAYEIAEKFNGISAEARRFSRSNRLPLTWGWLLEKLETESVPMEQQAFALIGEVWEQKGEERGIGILVDAMFADKGRFMFFILLQHFPKIEEKLVRNARTAKYLTSRFIRTIQRMETPEMQMVGAVLKKWLIFWKNHPGGNLLVWNYVNPYFCWVFNSVYFAKRPLKENERQLRFLEELVEGNEEAQGELTEFVLEKYLKMYRIFIRSVGIQNISDEDEDHFKIFRDYFNIFHDYFSEMVQRGQNLHKAFMKQIYYFLLENRSINLDFVKDFYQLYGDQEIESDLECFQGLISCVRGVAPEIQAIIRFLAMRVTFRFSEVKDTETALEVLEGISSICTEDEMFVLRERGAFPNELLRSLIQRFNRQNAIEKIPILILWLYEDSGCTTGGSRADEKKV